jgi:hypothetical protein
MGIATYWSSSGRDMRPCQSHQVVPAEAPVTLVFKDTLLEILNDSTYCCCSGGGRAARA